MKCIQPNSITTKERPRNDQGTTKERPRNDQGTTKERPRNDRMWIDLGGGGGDHYIIIWLFFQSEKT